MLDIPVDPIRRRALGRPVGVVEPFEGLFFLFLSKCICTCLPLHIFNIEIYGGYYVFIFLFTDYVHILYIVK